MAKKLNYKGIDIRIEYEKGERKPESNTFSTDIEYGYPMYADYGYIEGTIGADGEDLDVYVGPNRDSDEVFIATLLKKSDEDGERDIDEWKILLGFSSYEEAQEFMMLQYGSWMCGIIYRSSLEDVNLTAELSRIKARKETLFIQESQQPKLTLPTFEEVGRYGGEPGKEKIVIIG